MSTDLVLFKLQFQTAKITADDIRQQYGTQEKPNKEMLENVANAYRALDGVEVVGAEWEYIPNDYSIYDWDKADDSKIKELFYQYEQDKYFGNYENMREEFEEEWNNGEYELNAFHVSKALFKIIEKLNEGSKGNGIEH